jgi:hypothetical protein
MRLPLILVTTEQDVKQLLKWAYDVFSSVRSSLTVQKKQSISAEIFSVSRPTLQRW